MKQNNKAMNKVYVQNHLIVLRKESDDWAVLYNPGDGKALGINPTGIDIWEKINGSNSIKDIIKEIKQEYEGPPPDIVNEIKSFMDKLSSNDFIILKQ
jgi:Coenzyme PQQ synthesis protein D (PqqD)